MLSLKRIFSIETLYSSRIFEAAFPLPVSFYHWHTFNERFILHVSESSTFYPAIRMAYMPDTNRLPIAECKESP